MGIRSVGVGESTGISKGLQSHINLYNAAERLVKVSDGSNNEIASYAYNPFGQRIKKTVSQNPGGSAGVTLGTTFYFYADEGLIAETDGAGNLTVSYGWNPGGIWGTAPVWKRDFLTASTTANATEHYYHVDHLGTPQRLTNAAGEITWRGYSESFGKTVVDTSLAPVTTAVTVNNLRSPGQVEGAETGTFYNYFRDYDSGTGRYVQSDPIGLRGGINTYSYVNSDPVTGTDPYGLIRYSPERPLPPHPGRGGFECDGSGGIEIYLPPGLSSLQSKCLGDCLRQHEDSHIQDFQTRYRNVCKGRRNGERPTFDSPKQNNDSEKKAYDSELNCLQAKLNGLNGCEECKDTIESRMKEIPLRRRQYE